MMFKNAKVELFCDKVVLADNSILKSKHKHSQQKKPRKNKNKQQQVLPWKITDFRNFL